MDAKRKNERKRYIFLCVCVYVEREKKRMKKLAHFYPVSYPRSQSPLRFVSRRPPHPALKHDKTFILLPEQNERKEEYFSNLYIYVCVFYYFTYCFIVYGKKKFVREKLIFFSKIIYEDIKSGFWVKLAKSPSLTSEKEEINLKIFNFEN